MSSALSPQFTVECESPLRAVEGNLKLQGWIAGVATHEVRLRLGHGENLIFECTSAIGRPDVAATFPDLTGAETSGFKLEALLPPGLHLGTLEYRCEGSGDWVPFHSLSITADLAPLRVYLESSGPATHSNDPWFLHGWCFHPHFEIESLTIEFAHLAATMQHGDPRPDVAAAFPSLANTSNSGFSGHLHLEAGSGPLYVSARLVSGDVVQSQLMPMLEISDQQLAHARKVVAFARADQIKLPSVSAPEVSIIIPIYNQLDLTLGCLESLVRHAGATTFEVIIIDDNSERLVCETLPRIQGLRLISNDKNQGFIYNCNLGAQESLGKYVLFLNNDTEVTTGWLEAMLRVFHDRPLAGAVGAKLVYPDGRLQEAGGILWEDGSGINYGKGDDSDRPEYNYLRQVDYCSGACLLVPRGLFFEVGGFDTRYRPAYYEDADLAFAIRAAGQEVYYQPATRIIHFEGVSSGTDTRCGVKKHQVVNQAKFATKWAATLASHGGDASLQHLARDRYATSRILVIDACALTPDADSGSLRMFNLLHMMANKGAKVTFAAENLQSYEPYTTQLRIAGVEHLSVPHIFNLTQYLESHGYAFDVIILSRKHIAQQFIDTVRRVAPEARIVFDTVDLMFLRLERQAAHEDSPALKAEAAKCKDIELSLCGKSDIVFVVSPVEAELLEQYVPKEKIVLVSNIHKLYSSPVPFEERHGIMFVGGYQHPPNVDAVDFLFGDILPLVRGRLPELDVHIVGSNMPDRWQDQVDKHTHLHGFVADLEPLYEQVRLALAPLRYGAGVKGKVNQPMAHGVPVVATTMAVEGMHLTSGLDVLVADSAAEFADAIVRLHQDRELWHHIARGGIENIESHFSFAAVEKELLAAMGSSLLIGGQLRPLPRRAAALYTLGERIGFGRSGGAEKYIREGWGNPEETSCWMVGPKAVIEMELQPGSEPSHVRVTVYPFLVAPALPRQRIRLSANGREIAPHVTIIERAEPTTIEYSLPSDLMGRTHHLSLTLHSPDATAPKSFGTSPDERKLSFAIMNLIIQSRDQS